MIDQVDENRLRRVAGSIGVRLRNGRRNRFPEDTQADFARRVGVSRYTWQKVEQGDSSVSMATYLCAAFGDVESVMDDAEMADPDRH